MENIGESFSSGSTAIAVCPSMLLLLLFLFKKMWYKQTYSYKQAKYSYSLLVKDQLNESKYLHRTHYLPLTPRCTSTGPLQPCPLLQSQKKLELPTNNLDEHCESFCRHREDTPFLWILVSLHWIKKWKNLKYCRKESTMISDLIPWAVINRLSRNKFLQCFCIFQVSEYL